AAETFLSLWENKNIPTLKRSNVQRAYKALQNYARVFPIGQPHACLWQGVWAWNSGRLAQAKKWRAKGLAAAKKQDMPYSEGLLYYEMGRRLPLEDPERLRHLA